MNQRAVVYAPGSVGNVGPGLDILGMATAAAGDTVSLTWSDGDRTIVDDPGHPELPRDPLHNTAAIAATAVLRRLGVQRGIRIRVRKGLPLSGGQGGSAASAVAGAVAASLLCDLSLDHDALLACALEAESAVAGRHLDNLAPSLLGGLVLVRSLDPIDVIRLPVPDALRVVLVHPHQRLGTREARAALPATVPRALALQQAANVAAMVAGACLGDLALLGRAIDDRIAEPARAPMLPGFTEARRTALEHGALGCSISGAGPTAFALTDSDARAVQVAEAMVRTYAEAGVPANATITEVDRDGARAVEDFT
jgi:homoserine kinase